MRPFIEGAVRFGPDGHIGLAELARPPHNLLDGDFVTELVEALETLAADPECRAIVIAAEGRSFCAGGNFGPAGVTPAPGQSPADLFRESASRIYGQGERIFRVGVPLVAAVHGAAIGAGLGLALACDLRVTCPEAFFAGNFVRLGIHPGFAASVTLPALVGPGRAADLLLTGRRVHGDEALAIGLAERCVPQAEVRTAALALAGEIAAAAPLAVAATRATLRAGVADRVREALAREIEEQAKLIATADAAEGISAMLQRREPRFNGC
ncbi:MAG: enoyl-CoA hydratase/isomerase family protein [Acidobacteria bacterium]|nr:enoyl-CoA hydratase/isomerase family protein [Acidobacteriota bacterium]